MADWLIPGGRVAALSALWTTRFFPLGDFESPPVADFDGQEPRPSPKSPRAKRPAL